MLRAKLGSKKQESNNNDSVSSPIDLTPNPDLDEPKVDLKNDQARSEINIQIKDQPKTKLDQPLSLVPETSLFSDDTQAYSETRLRSQTSLVLENSLVQKNSHNKEEIIDVWQVSKETKGYLKVPYTYIDSVIKLLDPYEQAVYLQLFRLSWGYGKDNCCIGLPKLSERTNMSLSSVQRALTKLIIKKLVEKISWEIGKGKEQGIIYRLPLPSSLVSQNSLSSENSLVSQNTLIDHDDDYIKKDHHQNNQTEHEKSVMMIYQKTTQNTWTKADSDNYIKIKNIPIEKIEIAIRLASQRATNRPNSLAYFVKEILSVASPTKQSRSQQKKALEKIVDSLRNSRVGSSYPIADLAYDVKEACIRDDIPFDHDLFNNVVAKHKG